MFVATHPFLGQTGPTLVERSPPLARFLLGLLLGAALLAAIGLWRGWSPPPDVDQEVVLQETLKVLNLETVIESGLAKGAWRNDPKLGSMSWEKSISYSFRYRVVAGFDLQSPALSIDEDGAGGWVVQLPQPTILSVWINPEYHAWDDKIGNRIQPSDFNLAEEQMRTYAKDKALERDILGTARAQARDAFQTLGQRLEPALGGPVTVTFGTRPAS